MYLLCIWNGEVILPKMALSCSKKVVSVELTLKSGLRWTYGVEWKSCIHSCYTKTAFEVFVF